MHNFFAAILYDPRIGVSHIALYMALYRCWIKEGGTGPVSAFSHEIMPIAKIAGSATYHRVLRELDEYGYLKYEPSFNRMRRSRMYLAEPAALDAGN
ncbi:hypothetical protein GCM10023188_15880 [Pontibacter saemangeumensis]|uniref:Helix-turn-helix domain-containing protein n=2 Tax=Pontibacter saemangeumensis TaxID=1084525 RepID=A0ABP8LIU3_9BACT